MLQPWNKAEREMAAAEGWGLFCGLIGMTPDSPLLSDEQVMGHVEKCAEGGSQLHVHALAIHAATMDDLTDTCPQGHPDDWGGW